MIVIEERKIGNFLKELNIMYQISTIYADLSCREKPPVIYAKQWDDSRRVRVYFFSNGEKFDMESVRKTELHVLKPDGKMIVRTGRALSKYCDYDLDDQVLSTDGEGLAEFVLFGYEGEILSTVPAKLVIFPQAFGDEAAVSTNEFRAVTDRIDILEKFAEHFIILTKEEYTNLEHGPDPDTVYFVKNQKDAEVYIGSLPFIAGAFPSEKLVVASLSSGVCGQLSKKEDL